MKERFRRKYLVDTPYQLSQVAILLVANILTILIISALLSWFYLLVWDGSVAYNHNQRVPVYLLAAALIVIVSTVFFSLRRSRIIAGMMLKIQLLLEDAEKGIYPDRDFTFRQSDHFRELAAPLDRCLKLLKNAKENSHGETVEKLTELAAQIDNDGIDQAMVSRRLKQIATGLHQPLM